ncbi:hypothetical protein C8Z91_13450 [Paenibacillus elgii]|uniref:Uncharacterized protein n=1 Tax=Paenibacillus elgii TaxID=189691 RepID=A0A2T6G369_9BACL|nr:hypothetical protein [Paenibacillus elgii]PUA38604.1 hypothetical protein C8Z91_13450 [Paenibacillus elgii]
MAKYANTGSFNFTSAGVKTLFTVPKGINGTLAISNNSNKSFVLLLNNTVTIAVKPYGIARIGSLSGGFPTKVTIRTKGPTNGAYIFQQN